MADRPIPQVNYAFAPRDGHNIFAEKFRSLSDDDWCQLLVRSITEPIIDEVQFPGFPEDELQNRIHGNYGATAIAEAAKFFKFVKGNTYKTSANSTGKRLLDFGCGWGRTIRPFMRDFEFADLYGFEPNFLYCALARTLNPYVAFLAGKFVPTGTLPPQFFNLTFGWSIFSHLSHNSAVLWLGELARVTMPGGWCVFTTWGDRFLRRLQNEANQRQAGQEIHWYSSVCIDAAGSLEQRLAEYERGEFVWFTSGGSTLYGEAFVSETALRKLILENQLPFEISLFDKTALAQDGFVLKRL
jgi:SAM-dependent methyltransferase